MALNKYKLGELIEKLDNKNDDLKYGVEYALGVSNNKELIPTKADLNGRDLTKFSVIYPGDFVYNHRTSRHGDKFCIAYNATNENVICTEDYTVFRIRDDCKNKLLNEWLYMYFHRPEMDRFIMYNSWGSSTEFFNWDDMRDIEIDLPPLQIQQKYVDIYKAMVANQQSYENGLDDLKLVCEAYIENQKSTNKVELGTLIQKRNEKNSDFKIKKLIGVGKTGFIKPKQSKDETNGHICYLVKTGDFCFAPPQIHQGSIDLYYGEETVKCSDAYAVFFVKDTNVLHPEYLKMVLTGESFQHYACYYRDGVREQFSYDQLSEMTISLSTIEEQKAIANIYNIYCTRKEINEKLKLQIKEICPILIKGSIANGG